MSAIAADENVGSCFVHIEPLLHEETSLIIHGERRREDVLRHLAVAAAHEISHLGEEELFRLLLERERQYPTCTPEGVAFPHAMVKELDKSLLVIARLEPGVDFRVANFPPVEIVFGVFSPVSRPFEHVRVLARLARIARAPGAIERLSSCRNSIILYNQLIAEDRAHE